MYGIITITLLIVLVIDHLLPTLRQSLERGKMSFVFMKLFKFKFDLTFRDMKD